MSAQTCSIAGCDRSAAARGWCTKHYWLWYTKGDPTYTRPSKNTPAEFLADPTDERHGTTNGYNNLRCRCDRCRSAWAIGHAEYLNANPVQRQRARARETSRRWGAAGSLVEQGLMTASMVATALDLNRGQITRMTDAGTLPVERLAPNGRRLYARTAVAWVAQQRINTELRRIHARYGSLVDVPRLYASYASLPDLARDSGVVPVPDPATNETHTRGAA